MALKVTVKAVVNLPVQQVWEYWTSPQHIKQWNNANDEWHTPYAENDLQPWGKFTYTMAAKDGSFSFDFWGIYTNISEYQALNIRLGDDRSLDITFESDGNSTLITETFDAENENPADMQQAGWQAILDNFKKYAESL